MFLSPVSKFLLFPERNGLLATVYPFAYTGTEQTFSVPEGVSSVTVTAAGGSGGWSGDYGGSRSSPGFGGLIVAMVSVAPLSTLYVYVGGAGNYGLGMNYGGYNGGGNASVWYNSWYYQIGGGGGGASDVRTVKGSLNSRLVVAGGGGGADHAKAII